MIQDKISNSSTALRDILLDYPYGNDPLLL